MKIWNKFKQFAGFSVVGVANTLISYVVYLILVNFQLNYLWANAIGFVVSILNAYYWNNKYVFKKEKNEKRIWWKALLKTFLSYAGTGLILSNVLLVIWVDMLQISQLFAPILNLFITVPLNFWINKYWAFSGKISKKD